MATTGDMYGLSISALPRSKRNIFFGIFNVFAQRRDCSGNRDQAGTVPEPKRLRGFVPEGSTPCTTQEEL